jgi:lactocepin
VLLPGCGSSNNGKPIPASQSARLIQNIQRADQYSQSGFCTRAHTKVKDARFVLGQVPTSVSSSVRQGISDGLARLDSLISSQCNPPQKTQTDTTPTDTTPTTQSQTTPTTTSQTQTTQTQTTQTQTQTTSTSTVPTGTVPTGTTTTGNGGTPPGGTSATP